jgi:hypothetical protein
MAGENRLVPLPVFFARLPTNIGGKRHSAMTHQPLIKVTGTVKGHRPGFVVPGNYRCSNVTGKTDDRTRPRRLGSPDETAPHPVRLLPDQENFRLAPALLPAQESGWDDPCGIDYKHVTLPELPGNPGKDGMRNYSGGPVKEQKPGSIPPDCRFLGYQFLGKREIKLFKTYHSPLVAFFITVPG